MDLSEEVYKLTSHFPKDELYGLTSQLRRAAVSVVSNIAEGAARQTKKEFIQFLHISLGSAAEVEAQLELSKRFGYVSDEDVRSALELRERISKMSYGLIRNLRGRK